jgi:DNA-binding CsgD family transcriptional regulator
VALAVLRGLTDQQIARELGLSVSSVRTYLGRLFDKTGASRRAGLAQSLAQLAAAPTGRSP